MATRSTQNSKFIKALPERAIQLSLLIDHYLNIQIKIIKN